MNNYAWWIRGEKFAELAKLSIESVRRIDPTAHIHVCTDEPKTTPLPDCDTVHVDEPGRPAMVANLDAQIRVLGHLQKGERVLFLDADTLLRRPFDWGTEDLTVTWRSHVNGDKEMAVLQPYNYGVVGAHVRPVTIEAFYWLRARILRMNMRNQAWYGNQLALADLVGKAPEEGTAVKSTNVRWALMDRGSPLTVRQLPCEVWNYSPDEVEDVSARAILHLKGDRKDLMQHYARAS